MRTTISLSFIRSLKKLSWKLAWTEETSVWSIKIIFIVICSAWFVNNSAWCDETASAVEVTKRGCSKRSRESPSLTSVWSWQNEGKQMGEKSLFPRRHWKYQNRRKRALSWNFLVIAQITCSSLIHTSDFYTQTRVLWQGVQSWRKTGRLQVLGNES